MSSTVLDNEIVAEELLANKINNFFSSITSEITPLEPESVVWQHGISNVNTQLAIDEESVFNKLTDMCASKSSGIDGIPNWVLKNYACSYINIACRLDL